jgi:hypothetical protein
MSQLQLPALAYACDLLNPCAAPQVCQEHAPPFFVRDQSWSKANCYETVSFTDGRTRSFADSTCSNAGTDTHSEASPRFASLHLSPCSAFKYCQLRHLRIDQIGVPPRINVGHVSSPEPLSGPGWLAATAAPCIPKEHSWGLRSMRDWRAGPRSLIAFHRSCFSVSAPHTSSPHLMLCGQLACRSIL